MMTRKLKILIVDDHAVVRRGLKQIVSETPDMEVEGEASTGSEAMKLAQTHEWDAMILDLTMPGGSGLDVLADLTREHPEGPVLVLSMHPEDQVAIRVLRAGAAGYMTKESAPEELVKAIRKVCAGGKYVSPVLAEQLAWHLGTHSDRPLHDGLSDREYQVLRLIASGLTTSQIALELSLSVKTVSTYRRRILDKMGLHNNAELTRYAVEHSLGAQALFTG